MGKRKQYIKKIWKLTLENESILSKIFKVLHSLYLRFVKIAPSYIDDFLTLRTVTHKNSFQVDLEKTNVEIIFVCLK